MHGRPFGGTAVVIRKNLVSRCSRITTNNPRITSVCMKNGGDAPDVVISSVYIRELHGNGDGGNTAVTAVIPRIFP